MTVQEPIEFLPPMTVQELIEVLKEQDQNAIVVCDAIEIRWVRVNQRKEVELL